MNNIETEKIVLNTAMMSQTSLPFIMSQVKEDDFCDSKHQKIYNIIRGLFEEQAMVGFAPVFKVIIDKGMKDELNSTMFAISNTQMSCDVKRYIASLKDDSNRRKLVLAMKQQVEKVSDRNNKVTDIAISIEEISKDIARNKISTVSRLSDMATGNIEDLSNPDSIIPTYFGQIDRKSFLRSSDLVLLAARPSIGKSTFARNIAWNICSHGGNVLFFSLEMGKDEIREALISQISGVDSEKISTGTYDLEEKVRLMDAMQEVDRMDRLAIEDETFDLSNIIMTSRNYALQIKPSIIIIDYLQLISIKDAKYMKTEEIVSTVSRQLKLLNKTLKVPIIALSQLSREIEKRIEQRPTLADLRYSGALEQDADKVWFLWNDRNAIEKDEWPPDLMKLYVAKNRKGKRYFDIDFLFKKSTTEFVCL